MDVVVETPITDNSVKGSEQPKKTGRKPTNGFKKGQSGNPSGRPKDITSARYLKSLLDKDINKMYKIAWDILGDPEAKNADKVKLLMYFFDRACGKIPQAIDINAGDSTDPAQMSGKELMQRGLKWCEQVLASNEDECDEDKEK